MMNISKRVFRGMCPVVAALAVCAMLVLAPAAPALAAAVDSNSPSLTESANSGADDLSTLLSELSPEEMKELIQAAVRNRLEIERKQVIEEIRGDLLLDPADMDAALKILNKDPKNTQADNVERTMVALAKVDYRFGKATKLLAAGKADDACATIAKDLNVQEATYRSAARYTLYARAMVARGKYYDAVDAYQNILVVMADRISFAAAAAIESAALYEKMQRFSYAKEMYDYAVDNYGLTFDDSIVKMIERKLDEYTEFAADPLGWAETAMGQVKTDLGKGDIGTETQAKQDKIVAVITDMIKTAEEKQKQQQSGQGQGQKRQRQKKPGQCEGQGQGKGKGMAQGQGKQPSGAKQPSSPAQVSALVPGATARPTKRSEVRDTNEAGDWANLPPRQRQKLMQLRTKIMSERYRDLIRKYRTKVAEQSE